MLITLMLLAVLAIGAVSAADDTASDNLTVTDESVSDNLAVDDSVADDNLIGANYDSDYHGIEVVDYKVDITDETEEIAHIDLPSGTKGSFRIYNGNEIVARQDFNPEDDTGDPDEYSGWNDDGDDRCGYITMNMFNLTNVRDGDVLTFKFLELKNSEYTEVDMFTLQYNVTLIDSTMQLTEVGGSGFGEDNYDITVGNIYFNDAAKNFTVVNATQKAGVFIITNDNDKIIFTADLSKATCIEYYDDTLGTIYLFGFSINDLNDYISKNFEDANSIKDLVDDETIEIDGGLYFEIYESLDSYENEDEAIFEKTMTVTDITEEGILFVDEDAVYVDYENKLIEMKDDWNETVLYTFTVRTDIKGRIVIYINDNQTPAFNKSLEELQDPDFDPADESYDYVVTVADLNLTEAGTYEIHEYLVGENGDYLHKYDLDEPLTVKLIESQETTVDNVTIHINPDTIIIPSNDAIITIINASDDNLADVLLVYVDDNEEPLQFVIGDCNIDGENYFINASQLNLGVGKHNIKLSYKDNNKNGTVELQSNLIIEIMYDGPAVYTDMGVAFVYISFKNEIEQDKFEGKINLTIKDGEEIKESFELDASQLIPFDDDYVITTNQIKINLTGNYTVLVKYFDGSEAETQAEDNVTFKAFDPKDYGAAIKDTIKNKDDYLITFSELPLDNDIIVNIDGNNTLTFDPSDILELNSTVYYLKYSQFVKYFQFDDGPHSINVSLESDKEDILLANGTVIVDLVENIDPSLTISIANITEGAAANIVISTNETFTGEVLVKIGNNNYTVSVTNGTGSLPVAGLAVGTHNATAFFKANAIFNESTKNTTFTVNPKVATNITAPVVTTTYATSKNIVVTLKDANGNTLAGKEVVITFNGASKNVTTNDKGQAVLAIGTKLAPKKYDATFKFAGDSNYLASTGTVKVTVNKAKPKITAKKKTFKAKKKTKKYTIVLITDKKKPLKKVKVTIKIGKKKFKAKTNNKGKATFKLKKLTKRGKYKATVKFSGNKYYKAVSKKVKITIKK